MAMLLRGKTTCAVCGQVFDDPNNTVAFPAFLRPKHRLHQFNDSVFHLACFQNWPERTTFERLYKRYREIWDSRPTGLSFQEMEEWGKRAFQELEVLDEAPVPVSQASST